MAYKLPYIEFDRRAKLKFGERFTYSGYSTLNTSFEVICSTHGTFITTPQRLLRSKHGCSKCHKSIKGESLMLTSDVLLDRFRDKFGDIYNYSKSQFKSITDKVTIICKQHGEFSQTPADHLKSVHGCPKCAREDITKNQRLSTEEFISRCINIHGDEYDYSVTEYVSLRDKVKIICKTHGVVTVDTNGHMNGARCRKCADSEIKTYNFRKSGYKEICNNKTSLYIFRLYDKYEDFIKIGISKDPDIRKGQFPYQVEVISIFESDSDTIWDLESHFHRNNKKNKYVPKKTFGGYTECFKTVWND